MTVDGEGPAARAGFIAVGRTIDYADVCSTKSIFQEARLTIITLRGENGDVAVETEQLRRFRRATDSEKTTHPSASARLDYLTIIYVRNTVDEIISRIQSADASEAELFGKLSMVDEKPVYFRGPGNAIGPISIGPSLARDGIHSALRISSKIQYVRETPQAVHDVIAKCRGTAVPPIDVGVFSQRSLDELETTFGLGEEWDADVTELAIKKGM